MDVQPKYKRVTLKLSGEVLGGSQGFGIEGEQFLSSQMKLRMPYL